MITDIGTRPGASLRQQPHSHDLVRSHALSARPDWLAVDLAHVGWLGAKIRDASRTGAPVNRDSRASRASASRESWKALRSGDNNSVYMYQQFSF